MFPSKKEIVETDITSAQGFERAYRQHVAKLCRIAYNQTGEFSEAENVVHSVFSRLWEKRYELDVKGSLENYLTRAVKLAVLDLMRKQTRRRALLENHLADYCGASHCTENDLNYSELTNKVAQLTDQLPCQCRKVFQLKRLKGMSNKEIASALLISEKMVDAHITIARKFLRTHLKEYQGYGTVLILYIFFY